MRNHRVNREPVFRRSFNHAHIAKSNQRHVKRSRNRRRRHRQNVDILLQLFQSFFMPHSEALLLIHYQQAKVAKLNVFREQTMRSDQHIHFS